MGKWSERRKTEWILRENGVEEQYSLHFSLSEQYELRTSPA